MEKLERPTARHERVQGLGDVFNFMRLLWAVHHGLERRSIAMNSRIGVTGLQRMVIRFIGLFPGISPGELAEILCVDPSTLTGVFQRLAAAGLVMRKADPRDRRLSHLRLTARGRRLDVPTPGTVESAVEKALRGIGHAKISVAKEILARLAERLDSPA